MKRPRPDDRGPAKESEPAALDKTLLDMTWPEDSGSAGKGAVRPVMAVSVATDVGRVRRNNEDYVQAERILHDGQGYSVWAVADGVGGGPLGERASRAAVETVIDHLTSGSWSDPSAALSQAFALANHEVFDLTGEGAAASTLVVAVVSEPEGIVTIANVGDSRAYIVVGTEARPITEDHSIVAARVAAGQITAEEARTAPDRNVLTRSIGSEKQVVVDVFGPRKLQPNERLVLCTDGVHGMIDDATLGQLGGSLPIPKSAGALVTAAVEAGGRDNATALVGGHTSVGAADANGTSDAADPIDPANSTGSKAPRQTAASPDEGSAVKDPAAGGRLKRLRVWFAAAYVALGLAIVFTVAVAALEFTSSGAAPTPSPTPSPSPTPTATATSVPTPEPTPTTASSSSGGSLLP